MHYDDINLPQEAWVVRLTLGHHVSADGELIVDDEITGRRRAGTPMPIWKHCHGEAPTTIRFPEPIVFDYALERMVPLANDFHALASRICGRVISNNAAAIGAPNGVDMGLMADIEICGATERPTGVDLWAETHSDQEGTVKLLCRYMADEYSFLRRAFDEQIAPAELTSDGRNIREVVDEPAWRDLRDVVASFRHDVVGFLSTLPE